MGGIRIESQTVEIFLQKFSFCNICKINFTSNLGNELDLNEQLSIKLSQSKPDKKTQRN